MPNQTRFQGNRSKSKKTHTTNPRKSGYKQTKIGEFKWRNKATSSISSITVSANVERLHIYKYFK